MVDVTPGPDTIEDVSDLGKGDPALYAYWRGQESIAAKDQKRFTERGRKIVQRYRDERTEALLSSHRFNILWSNVQTLLPTLYARTPKPDVERRFKDQDDAGRLAATLLERSLSFSLEQSDFDEVMAAAVQDRLLPGRGTCRVLYMPHYGDEIEEGEQTVGDGSDSSFEATQAAPVVVDNQGDEGEPLRKVDYEEVKIIYVYWEDYLEGPARTWREVPWIRYRAYMTRAELIERFGKKIGSRVNLDSHQSGSGKSRDVSNEPLPDIFKKACVHEVWDKENKRVIWYAPGTPEMILDEVDDPLGLPDFFPSPEPLSATMTNDKRIPVPDFTEYQDQAIELDTLTARIDSLTKAIKVSGIYPGAEKQVLQQLVDAGTENRLIPVEDWAAFSDKGGLQNIIQYLPIKDIAATLIQLYDARDRVKSILYEITGIGDIMRGDTQPNETATAQQLKTQFVTRRVVPQQRAVAAFARDVIRLMAAIIAGHFSAETITKITGYPQLAPVPQLPAPPMQWVPDPRAQQQQSAPQPAGPPPGALQEGGRTHFANGQQWTLRNGQAMRVA